MKPRFFLGMATPCLSDNLANEAKPDVVTNARFFRHPHTSSLRATNRLLWCS